MISEDQLDSLRNFKKFASRFLVIKDKAGHKHPFVFNRAQLYITQRLDDQLKALGYVRAVILKGRQQGCSTLIQGRFFHKVITSRGKKAFILTHEKDATKNLFEMTKRYYDNLEPGLCPVADTSNVRELSFKTFDSGYAVGTAGNKGVGRSQTIQLFHGSELGFWPHAEEHAKGVLQTISNEPGTEIILESTANGLGNSFHSLWKTASSGSSEYQAIFVPWYWQNEYSASSDGMTLTEDEQLLMDYHASDGLTIAHLAWRRGKILGLSKDWEAGLELFKQEYPFTASEAFLNPIANIFILSKYVMKARKEDIESEAGLIIGVDPAIGDNDRTAIIRRRGRLAYNLQVVSNHNTMEIAGLVKRIIHDERPVKVYIDSIGIGAGVVDRLREMGYDIVEGINVSKSAHDKERFRNRRAELWSELRDWLTQDLSVQIPDDDELHAELCSVGFKYNSNGQLQIEGKDEMRARGMNSPDRADALMHTFAGGFYEIFNSTPMKRNHHHDKAMFT